MRKIYVVQARSYEYNGETCDRLASGSAPRLRLLRSNPTCGIARALLNDYLSRYIAMTRNPAFVGVRD